MICAERIVKGLNRFYSGHFQNTTNIKTFFGYSIPDNSERKPTTLVKKLVRATSVIKRLCHNLSELIVFLSFNCSTEVYHGKYHKRIKFLNATIFINREYG